ncbi:MAG: sugar ABC transporter permease [Clostridiales Family XIII bacterium]|jgi:multiple sugar transport system permease protein|nr:sugar ABC transporter permease [Clostridiales Family XIII bacterium]
MANNTKKSKWNIHNRGEILWGWIFVLPTMIGLIILNIIPIFQTIYQSFFKTGAFGRGNIFIGLDNYQKMFGQSEIWQSLLNTIVYAIIEVPLSIFIALVLAVLLNRKMKGRGVYRTIYFMPMVAAPAAVAMVWRWLYNSDFGLINQIVQRFHGTPISYISNPNTAIFWVAVVGIWSVIGYNMVLFISGLQEIPGDYYEAAAIDGASPVRQFFNITIPLISPTMFFVTVTRVIGAMQVFDVIYMMIDKSNAALPKTQSLVFLFYKYAFQQNNRGYGAAIIVLLLAIIMIITAIQNCAQKKWVTYN